MKIVALFAASLLSINAITVEEFCVDTKIVAAGGISTAELQQGTSGGSSVKTLQDWRGGKSIKRCPRRRCQYTGLRRVYCSVRCVGHCYGRLILLLLLLDLTLPDVREMP